jgi:hypothetical protein
MDMLSSNVVNDVAILLPLDAGLVVKLRHDLLSSLVGESMFRSRSAVPRIF